MTRIEQIALDLFRHCTITQSEAVAILACVTSRETIDESFTIQYGTLTVETITELLREL